MIIKLIPYAGMAIFLVIMIVGLQKWLDSKTRKKAQYYINEFKNWKKGQK